MNVIRASLFGIRYPHQWRLYDLHQLPPLGQRMSQKHQLFANEMCQVIHLHKLDADSGRLPASVSSWYYVRQ